MNVLKFLISEKRVSEELVKKLLSWKNSGFSVHNQVKIKSQDRRGRESLAQYILSRISSVPHFLEKMTYQRHSKTVLYRSKMNPVLKKNFAIFPVLDWIATLTTHIPNKGEQLIRYYGYYSNVSRRKRKKEKPKDETDMSEIDATPLSRKLKKRWSYFIRKVYETDPYVPNAMERCASSASLTSLMSLKKFLPSMPGKLPIRSGQKKLRATDGAGISSGTS